MDRLLIEGGQSLAGMAPVRPAKNALLPCMAAALLTDEALSFSDSADLVDIASMLALLRHLGVETQGRPGGPITLKSSVLAEPEAPYDLVRRMRASIVVLGPLLARFGRARVSLPADAPSAPGPWTSTSRRSKPWGPRSAWSTVMWKPVPSVSAGPR